MANNDVIKDFDSDISDTSVKFTLLKINDYPNCIMINVIGYIDTYNSSFFSRQINRVISSGYKNIILNMSELNYVSSTGIGSLVDAAKLVEKNHGKLVLAYIQKKVFEVFQLLGFSSFFIIKENLEKSIEYIENRDTEPTSLFPLSICCPLCGKKLKVPRQGRFKCGICKSIFSVSSNGTITL